MKLFSRYIVAALTLAVPMGAFADTPAETPANPEAVTSEPAQAPAAPTAATPAAPEASPAPQVATPAPQAATPPPKATTPAPAASPATGGVENRIGGVGGLTTGIGLSYGQIDLDSGWGWAVSGFPYWSAEERFLTVGARVVKLLHEKNDWRLFTAFGGMFVSSKQKEEDPDTMVEETKESAVVTVGPSVGVELKVEAISLAVEVPAAAMIPISGDEEFRLVPYPGIQVQYRW